MQRQRTVFHFYRPYFINELEAITKKNVGIIENYLKGEFWNLHRNFVIDKDTLNELRSDIDKDYALLESKSAEIAKNIKAAGFFGAYMERGIPTHMNNMLGEINILRRKFDALVFCIEHGLIFHAKFPQDTLSTSDVQVHFDDSLPASVIEEMRYNQSLYLVFVSGAEINKFGHALIYLGPNSGFLHINGVNNTPEHLSVNQFNKYMKDNNKHILGVQRIDIKYLNNLIISINNLLKRKWLWGAVVNNCLTFCNVVAESAGHSKKEESLLDLPSEQLIGVDEKQLIDTEKLEGVFVFNPDKIKSEYLLTMPILSLKISEIKDFIAYCLGDLELIVRLQGNIIKDFYSVYKFIFLSTTEAEELALSAVCNKLTEACHFILLSGQTSEEENSHYQRIQCLLESNLAQNLIYLNELQRKLSVDDQSNDRDFVLDRLYENALLLENKTIFGKGVKVSIDGVDKFFAHGIAIILNTILDYKSELIKMDVAAIKIVKVAKLALSLEEASTKPTLFLPKMLDSIVRKVSRYPEVDEFYRSILSSELLDENITCSSRKVVRG